MAEGAQLTDVEEVIARLEMLASDSGGRIELGPNVTDAEMLSWPVTPPTELRTLFRRVGGFKLGHYSFDFNHQANHTPVVADDYYPLRDSSTSWVVDDGMGFSTTFYIDIDAETGEWGRVFSFWRDPYASLVAPNFLSWLDNLATGMATALEKSSGTGGDLSEAFMEWIHESEESLFRDHHENAVDPVPVADALASDDTEMAEVAALLPAEAYLADLREAVYPTEVPFARFMPIAAYSRFHGGRFLAAAPLDDED